MKPWFLEAASSSVLAAVSTLHVALALIRKHRSPDAQARPDPRRHLGVVRRLRVGVDVSP